MSFWRDRLEDRWYCEPLPSPESKHWRKKIGLIEYSLVVFRKCDETTVALYERRPNDLYRMMVDKVVLNSSDESDEAALRWADGHLHSPMQLLADEIAKK